MTNDAKLGLLAGVAVVLVVAVFFYPKAGAGPASIGGPAAAAKGNAPPTQPPAQVAVPPGTVPPSTETWKFSEPRKQPPVSKDPLMWPQN
jgi:hypothetical protein